jgi:acetyl-CoA carboxylase biotin carboxylase subunit
LPIRTVFIANRGEIAVRIIRSCRRLGIGTVLAVSEADRDSLPARLADRTVCVGAARPGDSYLKIDTIVHAALGTKSNAIHPGYGFLSERAALARRCEASGLVFVGPTPEQIEAAGDKWRARREAEAAAVPVVPGVAVATAAEAAAAAERIGVPLLVKAVGGGGGRGMKRVDALADLAQAVELAAAEAGVAFGDPRVYLERLVPRARHVELQVLGDGAGRIVHLGERDCSVQRRYQKLIEEAPAAGLPARLLADLREAGVRFAQRLHYRGAGTVEFLVDIDRNCFYFMEMNARIQVEHPVTEAVTGIDLVAEQLAIAGGDGLRLQQRAVVSRGCSIECRINAEDPAHDFRPSPGTVHEAVWPTGEGIRVDTHIEAGSRVPPFYDSLLGKIIAHGADRAAALALLQEALAATRIEGVATNLPFHQIVLANAEFRHGGVDTGFVARLR